jgi:serine/threonine-protein kinase
MTDSRPPFPGGDENRRDLAERLYEEARLLQPGARTRFLDHACADDPELRKELDSLLEHADEAEALFDQLADALIPPDLRTAPKVSRYEVLNCIGVGGMGAVYRARDIRLNRDVALKFMPVYVSAMLDGDERLLMEARAAAALEHPNVCTVHEIGESEDGRPYIAMALCEGETLKDRLRRGPLPVTEAVDVASQIARGLGAAHAHGIVHRDVKPANIMLTPDGTVKLLDFGLAKAANVSVTRPGMTPGTVAYMSPEQTRGDAVGPESDLWSLGVVVYEMLTAVRPFRGGTDQAVIHAILNAAPEAVRKQGHDIPRSLERIVDRLLEKHPDCRYGNVDELLADLELSVPTSAGVLQASHPPYRRRGAIIAIAGSLFVALGSAALWWHEPSASSGLADVQATEPIALTSGDTPFDPAKTIAVLPFTNLSRDPEEDYFSDGLTEELIGVLSRVRALRVAARTSAFAFKEENRDIRVIGAALNVGTVLEGSVRRDGNRIRVAAQLINVADGFQLWSETYERELTDIFAIQHDLALSIASALRAELTPAERERLGRPPTASAEAFALYLKGRHFWNQRTPIGFEKAIEYFHRAIAADSQYAAAHAGLAGVYSLQGLSGALGRGDARERMRASLLRALELDDSIAEAHAVLGAYLHVWEWDADGAEREFLRAIQLDPSYTTARHYYGNLLSAMGRVEEALAQKTMAVELDPLAPALSETLAFTLLYAGRSDEALHHVSNALELDSAYWRAHAVLGLVYETIGRPEDAIREFERANELARARTHRTRADIARVLARTDREGEARQLITEMQAEAAATEAHEPAVATAFMALREGDAAFAWLEEAYRQRHPHLPFIAGDPRFANMDDDPRFNNLMRRIGVQRINGSRALPPGTPRH